MRGRELEGGGAHLDSVLSLRASLPGLREDGTDHTLGADVA